MILIILGLIFIVLAYVLNIIQITPPLPWGLILPHYLFIIGMLLITENINLQLNKDSLGIRIKNKDNLGLKLFVVGTVIGILFELYGVFVAKLWYSYFQNWDFNQQLIHYILGIIVGYSFPALVYFNLYKIIEYYISHKKNKMNLSLSPTVFHIIFVLGIIFLLIPFVLYSTSFSWHPITRGFLFAFPLIGLLFILEYIEIKKHRNTFINSLYNNNLNPLKIIILSSSIISISWELLNKLRPSWIYQNMPLMDIFFLGLPLGLIIAWPSLFIIYFSFYNIIFKKKEKFW